MLLLSLLLSSLGGILCHRELSNILSNHLKIKTMDDQGFLWFLLYLALLFQNVHFAGIFLIKMTELGSRNRRVQILFLTKDGRNE